MGRKRKLHLGNTPIGGAPVKSRRLARTITSQYHVIQNERSLVMQDETISKQEREQKLLSLDKQMEEMGGTNRYQQASIISTQHFKTSKWVASTLTKLYGQEVTKKKLKVLEVGAINIQLQQYNWMDVRAIDLNSQHPSIEECDFFTVKPEGRYEVLVCSMVINCVDEPIRRGEMLARLSCQLTPDSGTLFLVLPRRCINSPYVGGDKHFSALLNGLGLYELQPSRETPKLIFYILGNKRPETAASETSNGTENKDAKKAAKRAKKDGATAGSGVIASGAVVLPAWKVRARTAIAANMSAATYKHFSRDFSEVPANKFAIALPVDLTAGLFASS